MKNIRKFLVGNFIILALKIVGGLFLHSNTLLASSLFELVNIINSLFSYSKTDKGYKKFVSCFYSIIFVVGIVILNIIGFKMDTKPSLLILLILFACLVMRYVILTFNINASSRRKTNTVLFSNLSSNQDAFNYIVIIVSIILCKISRWVDILKYGDKIGCIIISLLIVMKLCKIIVNTFRKVDYIADYEKELNNRKELKRAPVINVSSFGGIRRFNVSITPKDNIGMVDFSSFMVNLQDYLLKKCDVAYVTLQEDNAYRKVINNARNSGSGNSTKNAQRKNTKKKNKKR